CHGRNGHIDHAAPRNVIDNNRNAYGIVDRLEVAVETLFPRLIVVGGYDQNRGGARLLCMAGQLHCFLRAVLSLPPAHRDAAFCCGNADFDDLLMLVMAQRRRFTGCAHWNQPVRPGLNLKLHETAKGIIVDALTLERSYKRCKGALEHSVLSLPSDRSLL